MLYSTNFVFSHKIYRMRISLLFILVSFQLSAQKHESFSGRLVYSITMTDTAMVELFPENEMKVYTNDTLVRVENTTSQLGLQVAIRHLHLNKSYLLLSTYKGNFAIQTKFEDSVSVAKYTFKKKLGGKKINGLKAKKVLVTHSKFEEPILFFYHKKISAKYLEGFENFPGLLLEYYVPTPDGLLKYELKSLEKDGTNLDLYGIPSDYQKITMNEFVDLMTNPAGE